MITLIGRRVGKYIAAVDPLNEEEMARIPRGVDCTITIKVPETEEEKLRRVMERKAWKLADLVAKNVPDLVAGKEAAMDWLKTGVGHMQIVRVPVTGHEVMRPRSMKEVENMGAFLTNIITYTCTQILPGVAESDLKRELEEFVADKRYESYER